MLIPLSFRSLKDLTLPGMVPVLLFSIIFSLVILTSMFGIAAWALFNTTVFSTLYMEWIADIFGMFFAFLIASALFPPFMPFIISFFDERIASIVEKNHYPGAHPHETPFWPQLMHDSGFVVKALLLNILCIPLYFVPVINLFVYYLLNGYLLGKEFFIMVAVRHVSLAQAKELWRTKRTLLLSGGIIIAFFSTIPIINLIIPLCGIALMTHLFHHVSQNKAKVITATLAI